MKNNFLLVAIFSLFIIFQSCYKNSNGTELIENKIGYYESGELLEDAVIIDSLRIFKNNYYKNGNIKSKITFERNDINTPWENAKMKGKYSLYYDDGKIHTDNTKENKEFLIINSWDINGQQILKDGNGIYKSYYDSGNIKFVTEVKNGRYEGKYSFYYETGQVEYKSHYKDGKLDGKWTYYNEDGSIDKVEEYKDGELVE